MEHNMMFMEEVVVQMEEVPGENGKTPQTVAAVAAPESGLGGGEELRQMEELEKMRGS